MVKNEKEERRIGRLNETVKDTGEMSIPKGEERVYRSEMRGKTTDSVGSAKRKRGSTEEEGLTLLMHNEG